METVPTNLSPIKDSDHLLQDVDINRLRAVVFRDVVSQIHKACILWQKQAIKIKTAFVFVAHKRPIQNPTVNQWKNCLSQPSTIF